MNKIILISGYLGSGKTSFIRSFMESFEGTVALLINDFGKVNIDALELEDKGVDLVELSNGSIFCSCLKDSFIKNLAKLLDYEWDIILIEGSGLADPSSMGDVLKVIKKISDKPFQYLGSICLLDGQYFMKEVQMMESVVRQVEHSHVALLNKTDLIDDRGKEEIRAKVSGLNPNISIIETSYGRCDYGKLIDALRNRQATVSTRPSLNTPENRPMTLIIEFMDLGNVREFTELLERILPYTNRMKGFVRIGSTIYKAESVDDSLKVSQMDRYQTISKEGVVVFVKNGLSGLRGIQKLKSEKIRIST